MSFFPADARQTLRVPPRVMHVGERERGDVEQGTKMDFRLAESGRVYDCPIQDTRQMTHSLFLFTQRETDSEMRQGMQNLDTFMRTNTSGFCHEMFPDL